MPHPSPPICRRVGPPSIQRSSGGVEEGFRGLPNKSSAPKQPHRKVDFKAMNAVRRLSRNPLLGAWRVHAALKREGIRLSPRTCGRMLALNRALYNMPQVKVQVRIKKRMPFRGAYRHQYWTVDVRYIDHQLGGGKIYVIAIMENYSRAIVASAVSRWQDTTAYLRVLFAAVEMHGSPEGLVSDSGAIFRSKRALDLYAQLHITKHAIAKRQPWQSYIETTFAIQRRMADYGFAQAATWDDLQAVHDRWLADYNYQVHWTHRHRDDGRESPADVLDWVVGRVWEPDVLHYVFAALRFGRRLDKRGYIQFRCWRLYGEPGLARHRVAIWLYKEQLTIVFDATELAHYTVDYEPDHNHLRDVTNPQTYETQYRSPQLPLCQFGDDVWLKILRSSRLSVRKKRPQPTAVQEQLLA